MIRQCSLPFSGRSSTSRANSLKSAQKASHYAGAQAAAVLRAIRESGAVGATDHEIVARTGISRSSCCARRNALIDAGLVVEHPGTQRERSRRAGPYQRHCTVYVSTEAAAAIQAGRAA